MSRSVTKQDIAAMAYEAYSKTTDNKNFLGKEMPTFDELTETQKQAWQNAIEEAIRLSAYLEESEKPSQNKQD